MKSATLSKSLLAWYQKNARKLPWRETRDPYKIWVSEIMLQQTQVKTVIPYYEKWIKKFPTLQVLAQAQSSDVMKYWAGLGYYRRARMLQAGAQKVARDFGGAVPNNVDELLKIPGIGRYTAGAITSIAFDKKAPIVDGNVVRILTRIYAIRSNVKLSNTVKQIWELAESLIPDQHPGDFNQAMMELGATICLPSQPRCEACPVKNFCEAHAQACVDNFPVKPKNQKVTKLNHYALILRKGKNVLIQKQSSQDRWGGLWTFPFWESSAKMKQAIGIKQSLLKKTQTIEHAFTRYQIKLHVYEVLNGDHKPSFSLKQMKWVSKKELSDKAFPAPHQQILQKLLP